MHAMKPTSTEYPAFIAIAAAMPVRPISEPTERSIPAVMMTAVMPRAMIPKNAKFRVTLYMFRSVMNTSDTIDMTIPMATIATITQNGWARMAAPIAVSSRRALTVSSMAAWPGGWPACSFMRSRWLR